MKTTIWTEDDYLKLAPINDELIKKDRRSTERKASGIIHKPSKRTKWRNTAP